MCFGEIAPTAAMRDPQAVQLVNSLQQSFVTEVHHVVVGDIHRVETAGRDRGDLLRIRLEMRAAGRLGERGAAIGHCPLEIAKREIRATQ